jgi:hypothetical protein
VRACVSDLVALAETQWRHRVVRPGESAYSAALTNLEKAEALLHDHRMHIATLSSAAPKPISAASRISKRSLEAAAAEAEEVEAAWELEWAAELGAIYHGMSAARLIFKCGDDETVSKTLHKAIKLRQLAGTSIG